MKTSTHFWSHLPQFVLEWEMFQTKSVEKIKTHILCSVTFPENRAVYEIMWKNTAEPDRPQMKTWRIRISRWVPKARNRHSEYVISIAFPLQQWLHERAPMLRYTYIASLVFLVLCGLLNLQFRLILQSCFIWRVTERMRKSVPVTKFDYTSCCEFTQ